jgi:hypothetical protein
MSDAQRSETVLLMLGFDASHKTIDGFLFSAADVLPRAKAYNISEEEGRVALEGLAAKGMISAVGDSTAWTEAIVTVSGFRRYADRFMPEYPETKRAVAAKIREGATAGDLIARSLGQAVKIVDWTLEDLCADGHIDLSRIPGKSLNVSRVSPSLGEA